MRITLLAAVALATACAKPPPEAPKELGDLSLYLFSHFDDEDPDALIAGLEALDLQFQDYELTGDLSDRSFTMPLLEKGDLGGVSAPPNQPVDEQTPVAVMGLSRHDLATNRDLIRKSNYVCIESDTTTFYGRDHMDDVGCFASGDCEVTATVNEVRKESILANVWYDLYKDHRNVELTDGRKAVIARSWIEDAFPSDSGKYSWNQLYTLEIWLASGKQTQRFHTAWSAVSLGVIGPDVYTNIVGDAIDGGFTNADHFVDGEDCKNDRERAYDRG